MSWPIEILCWAAAAVVELELQRAAGLAFVRSRVLRDVEGAICALSVYWNEG